MGAPNHRKGEFKAFQFGNRILHLKQERETQKINLILQTTSCRVKVKLPNGLAKLPSGGQARQLPFIFL
jgi:hypothetical protein